LRRLALLGTRFTMEGAFYPAVFARHGMTIVAPSGEERRWIHERYVGQMLRGVFVDETRDGVVAIVRRLREEMEIDGVIMGGTELTLLLPAPVVEDLPALDTTALHVAAIVKRLRT
jgi:aspartate racemase